MAALAVGNGRGRLLAAEHLYGLDRLLLARHAEVRNRTECFNLSQFEDIIVARDTEIWKIITIREIYLAVLADPNRKRKGSCGRKKT